MTDKKDVDRFEWKEMPNFAQSSKLDELAREGVSGPLTSEADLAMVRGNQMNMELMLYPQPRDYEDRDKIGLERFQAGVNNRRDFDTKAEALVRQLPREAQIEVAGMYRDRVYEHDSLLKDQHQSFADRSNYTAQALYQEIASTMAGQRKALIDQRMNDLEYQMNKTLPAHMQSDIGFFINTCGDIVKECVSRFRGEINIGRLHENSAPDKAQELFQAKAGNIADQSLQYLEARITNMEKSLAERAGPEKQSDIAFLFGSIFSIANEAIDRFTKDIDIRDIHDEARGVILDRDTLERKEILDRGQNMFDIVRGRELEMIRGKDTQIEIDRD